MNDARPGLDLRRVSLTGERPSGIAVSADGLRVLVFHDESGQVIGLESAGLQVVGGDRLGPSDDLRPRLRGRRGDQFFVADAGGRLAIFRASTLRFGDPVHCDGEPGDVEALPESSRVFIATSDGTRGSLERREGGTLEAGGRLDLGGRPLPGTLALCARRGLGAVLVKPAEGPEELVLWSFEPFAVWRRIPVGSGAGALAFSEEEDLLFVARPELHEVLAVELKGGMIARRVVMLGRAFHLAAQPQSGAVWAISRSLPHLVRVDRPLGAGPAPLRLEGVDPSNARLRFSPEGRLAAVPEAESGQLTLVDMYPDEPSYGGLLDRLDLGRSIVALDWSPFGDEFFAAADDGSVAAFLVNRGDRAMRDTGEFILQDLLRMEEREASKYPLFPPGSSAAVPPWMQVHGERRGGA